MSDWGGVHSTELAALNGMDLEMGSHAPYENNFLANPFLDGLRAGKFPTSVLDDKVRRNLYVMFKLNTIHDPAQTENTNVGITEPLSTKQHQAIARQVAEESMVLLKNEKLLPLDLNGIKTIAVIGANAVGKFASGGGAANIKAPYEITALEGIKNRLGDAVNVVYARGYNPPVGRGRRDRGDVVAAPASQDNSDLVTEAVAAAKSADLVIYIGGLNHNGGYDTEGTDRPDMKLPSGQDALIERIVEANSKTVVVLIGGGVVEMESTWLSKVPALLYAWYPGLEGGNALANVLMGDVNVSGKLPCTFPKQLSDSPAHHLNAYPGENGTVTYTEGLLVGYRWFDMKDIEPLFPFGHGLSYTSFEYSNLKLMPGRDPEEPVLTVEFDLTNTGQRQGAEAAQIYIQDVESSLPRPLKELKGFAKTSLNPGETKMVSVRLNHSSFAYYDPDKQAWVAEAGEFKILVGSSSRDIHLTGTFALPETIIIK
jgi:beta-glucosidase